MLTRFRPILVGTLLIANHLGLPGGAIAELSPSTAPSSALGASTATEEPLPWRPDSAIGLPGDLDPGSTPVKQPELWDGSASVPDPGMPRTSVFSVAPVAAPTPTPLPAPRAPAPVVAANVAGPKYEVEDNHHVRQFIDQFQTGYRRAVIEKWLTRSGH